MFLYVSTTGAKSWRDGLSHSGGRQKEITFGCFPALSLSRAREKRQEARTMLAENKDPAALKAEAKRERDEAKTFGDWCDRWFEKQGPHLDRKTIEAKKRYSGLLKAKFGKRLLSEITRADVVLFLREFEDEGKLETRDRVRATGEYIYAFGDLHGNGVNPFQRDLRLKHQLTKNKSTPRPALVKLDDVAELMKAIAWRVDRARFDDLAGHALRFLSLTAVRPGEIASAEWRDIDIEQAIWTVPAAKMKMDREHCVPLSRQALAILANEVRKITGHRQHVFSCSRDVMLSSMALNRRLRLLGYDTMTRHCAHGFRSSFSTVMNAECDRDGNRAWDADAIELTLAHVDSSSVRAIYNRFGAMSLYGPRQRLLQAWADRVDTMVAGNVVRLDQRGVA